MAAGDLTASTPTLCTGANAIKTHIDTLNLSAVTDKLVILPLGYGTDQFIVFKVERATS